MTGKRNLRHFVTVADLNDDEVGRVYQTAAETKAHVKKGLHTNALAGRTLGMIFEKPSMRTRMSFETAMVQAGGHAIDIRGEEIGLGKRESVKDVALVMSRYVDAIVARTFAHRRIEALARYAEVPVVNGLSDYAHPCQALADVFTIREKLGSLDGVHLVFVGDGNNVARSLAMLCPRFGMKFTLAAPKGYEFDTAFHEKLAKTLGFDPDIRAARDPRQAVREAHVVYTDVWASMGQESEAEKRKQLFRPYQVNGELMRNAPHGALVMHCLPAHRGDEISDEIIDGDQSIVYDQAENRLHVQKGLLFFLLGVEEI